MIEITKDEANKLREKYPDISISRTVREKHGRRGKRYCPEEMKYLQLIKDTNFEAQQILAKMKLN